MQKMIVGIDAWGRVVAVPEEIHSERVRLWNALRTATTFAELRDAVTGDDYDTIVSLTEHHAEDLDLEGAESDEALSWPPTLDHEFSPEMIDAYNEAGWPESLSSLMATWLKGVDLGGIAEHQHNMVSSDWIHIEPADQEEFVRRLVGAGWAVVESDALIAAADWR
jgi:hypothetical protein